jgi:hypothetical protein
MAVGVKVEVRDPKTEQQTLKAVNQTLIDYLWPLAPGGAYGSGWPMGGTIQANELLTQVARVPGLLSVEGISLFVRETDGWRRLDASEDITLERYQLPELMGVSTTTGGGDPEFPSGIGPLQGAGPGTRPGAGGEAGRAVPAPVIPDVC